MGKYNPMRKGEISVAAHGSAGASPSRMLLAGDVAFVYNADAVIQHQVSSIKKKD